MSHISMMDTDISLPISLLLPQVRWQDKENKHPKTVCLVANTKMGELERLFNPFYGNPSICVRNCQKTGRQEMDEKTSVQHQCSRPGASKRQTQKSKGPKAKSVRIKD